MFSLICGNAYSDIHCNTFNDIHEWFYLKKYLWSFAAESKQHQQRSYPKEYTSMGGHDQKPRHHQRLSWSAVLCPPWQMCFLMLPSVCAWVRLIHFSLVICLAVAIFVFCVVCLLFVCLFVCVTAFACVVFICLFVHFELVYLIVCLYVCYSVCMCCD